MSYIYRAHCIQNRIWLYEKLLHGIWLCMRVLCEILLCVGYGAESDSEEVLHRICFCERTALNMTLWKDTVFNFTLWQGTAWNLTLWKFTARNLIFWKSNVQNQTLREEVQHSIWLCKKGRTESDWGRRNRMKSNYIC